jgi:quercetin dioxygenase-like cupin family protein
MDTNPTSFALDPGDGESFWGFGSLWTLKASAEQTGGRVSVIEEVSPRVAVTPLHVHREDDETFYLLEGEITFYLEDERPIPAQAGSFVHVSGGAPRLPGAFGDRKVPPHHDPPARTLLPRGLWRPCSLTEPSTG